MGREVCVSSINSWRASPLRLVCSSMIERMASLVSLVMASSCCVCVGWWVGGGAEGGVGDGCRDAVNRWRGVCTTTQQALLRQGWGACVVRVTVS